MTFDVVAPEINKQFDVISVEDNRVTVLIGSLTEVLAEAFFDKHRGDPSYTCIVSAGKYKDGDKYKYDAE